MPGRMQTARLLLRPFEADDTEAVFAYASDPVVTRLMDWPRHETRLDSQTFIEDVMAGWSDGDDYCWGVVLRDTDALIGAIGCQFDEQGMHMGYVLARPWWGQGLATEAARTVFEAGRSIDDIYRFDATCDTENLASARVLEKIGMRCEARLGCWSERPNLDESRRPRDVFMYAWTR
ncbi:GNAT family N-acetyltransferase [Salinisphaera sp. T31B1]|uniref:GNAT family N-acetyltransferase n=1 Tax=Salinisphaera sp. T31B1 TaxID=727963 RepID=UPI00334170D5